MLRSTFFAAGLFVLLCGISLFYVEAIHYKKLPLSKDETGVRGFFSRVAPVVDNKRVVEPPDWVAFSLMSVGSVTMLYAVALPKKQQS